MPSYMLVMDSDGKRLQGESKIAPFGGWHSARSVSLARARGASAIGGDAIGGATFPEITIVLEFSAVYLKWMLQGKSHHIAVSTGKTSTSWQYLGADAVAVHYEILESGAMKCRLMPGREKLSFGGQTPTAGELRKFAKPT